MLKNIIITLAGVIIIALAWQIKKYEDFQTCIDAGENATYECDGVEPEIYDWTGFRSILALSSNQSLRSFNSGVVMRTENLLVLSITTLVLVVLVFAHIQSETKAELIKLAIQNGYNPIDVNCSFSPEAFTREVCSGKTSKR